MVNDSTLGKRLFTLTVVAMTILWTLGASAVAPLTASAASAGDLIRGTSFSTVYYYGSNGMRYTFPNEKTYFSWYTDFSGVKTISDSELAAIPLGGNAIYRPGTRWVKIQSNPKVYAVSPKGTLHWIESATVAEALYGGSGWNKFVDDVPDAFFADYTEGASLASAANLYNGALVSSGGSTYLIWGGARRAVSSAGMAANSLQSAHVLNTSVAVSAIAAGTDLGAKSNEVTDTAQMATGDGGVSTPATGGLTLSVASDTPAGATLPRGANGVEVLKLNASAAGGDSTLNSVVLGLGGVGASTNVANVYLYEGSNRLTEARSVNSSTRQVTFSSLGWKVSDGQSKKLSVVVETAAAATAADTMSFKVAAVGDVTASGAVNGSFPLSGNTFSFSGNSVGTITIAKTGSITNPSIGAQNAIVGKFLITAATEDAHVSRLRIKIDNATDHKVFALYQASTKLADGVWTSGDFVDFVLATPYVIADGNNKAFEVKMTVGGQANDTVRVYMDKDTDLVAKGGDFGFNMGVTRANFDGGTDSAAESNGSCTAATSDCSFSTIQGGDVVFAFNGPVANDVQVNSQDNVLFSFSITSKQNVTVKDIDFIVYADDDGDNDAFDAVEDTAGSATADSDGLINTGAEGNLKDIKVRYKTGGNTLLGPLELDSVVAAGDDADQTIDFTDDFALAAGQTLDLELTADIDNNATANTEFGATLDVSGIVIEDKNGDQLTLGTDITPSGDLTGNSQTARSATLVVALASAPTSTTVVQGSSNVNVAAFTMTAGVGSDISISSITVSGYGSETGANPVTLGGLAGAQVEDFVSSCSIYDGAGTLLDGPKGATASGATFVFDNVVWKIAAGQVALLDVYCNLSNPSDTDTDAFSWDIRDVSEDIVSVDRDGNDVDGTADGPNGTTTATVLISIAASGSLAIAGDSGTPNADILLTGTSNNKVSKFRFTATNEDFQLTKLTFSEEQAEDDALGTDATTYANNISSVTVSYPDKAGATQTKTAFMSGNEAVFDNLTFYVPANAAKTVEVSVNVPGIDRNAGGSATSGERLLLEFFRDTTNLDNFRAVGQGSGSVMTDNDAALTVTNANTGLTTFVVRETRPTVSLASGSPSGASVPGLSEVLRFTIAAASNDDVVVDEIIWKMTSTDNNGATAAGSDWNECSSAVTGNTVDADFSFYAYTDLSNELEDNSAWNLLGSTGANCEATADTAIAFVQLELATADNLVIAAGTTKTYSLWFDSTGASATNDDTMRFDIPADPIATTYIDSGDRMNAVATASATTFTVDTGGTRPAHGDVVCITVEDACVAGDEKALVTNLGTTDTNTYVSRGYLGTDRAAVVIDEDLDYLPSSFVWYDDGDTTDTATAFEDEVAGSYLVKNLPMVGGTLIF